MNNTTIKFIALALVFFILPKIDITGATEQTVVINEIAWVGTGASANDEWMELYNNMVEEIDLTGWTLENADGSLKIELAGKISAAGYFLLERTDDTSVNDIAADQIYVGSMSNSGEKLELKNADGLSMDSIDCSGGWFAGDNEIKASMERKDPLLFGTAVNWATNNGTVKNGQDAKGNAMQATPRNVNSAKISPSDPVIPENNPSDAPTENKATDKSASFGLPVSSQPAAKTVKETVVSNDGIIISEIFPNPIGSDRENEFIEFYNKSEKDIDLDGWSLENNDGDEYTISSTSLADTIIKSHGYFALFRKTTGIALTNDGDMVKVFEPKKSKVFIKISYENAIEGYSYNFVDGRKSHWTWSSLLTPGAVNVIKEKNRAPEIEMFYPKVITPGMPFSFDASDTTDKDDDNLSFIWDFGDGVIIELDAVEHTYVNAGKYKLSLTVTDGKETVVKEKTLTVDYSSEAKATPIDFNLNDENKKISAKKPAKKAATTKVVVKKKTTQKKTTQSKTQKLTQTKTETQTQSNSIFSEGDFVTVRGTVAVRPGIFGTQYFYITGVSKTVNGEVENGIQVYNYYKDFPALKIGDYAEVRGEITLASGEFRIKTKSRNDIKVIEKKGSPEPAELACEDVDNEYVGGLVRIAGEVTDKSGQYVYVDDGTAEMPVYVKKGTGIDLKNIVAGKNIALTGLVSLNKGNTQIMPRSMEDIVMETAGKEHVLGEISTSSQWALAERDKKNELMKYLLIFFAGALAVLGGWVYKRKR